MHEPLRVALLTDGCAIAAWQAQALSALQREDCIRITHFLPVRSTGSAFEWVCQRLAALEGLRSSANEALDAPLDVGAHYPDASRCADGPMPRGIDLVVNCGVEGPVKQTVVGRLGMLACECSGSLGPVGVYRAVMRGDR